MNGTSKEELLSLYEKVYYELGRSFEAMKQSVPNGRDYYPQGEHAIKTAVAEHDARLRAIDSVSKEIEKILGSISEGVDGIV